MSTVGDGTPFSRDVEEFIDREMDSVPHLEALLLLWNSRPKGWPVEEMAGALYVEVGEARGILHGLMRRRLAERDESERFRYWGNEGRDDALIEALEAAYRRDLVRISRKIHSKASPGVRDFADAFRFTKDKE